VLAGVWIVMDFALEFASALGGYVIAIGAIVAGWLAYHWQAIRKRDLTLSAFIELALLVLFALVITAWIVHAPWAS
jgi:hypothetical protein